jgi:CheY-like chemotaxis protein
MDAPCWPPGRPIRWVAHHWSTVYNAIVLAGPPDSGAQLIAPPFTGAMPTATFRDMLDVQPKTGRILVVEDEPLLQLVIAENMQDMGFTAEPAGTAAEARDKLRRSPGGFDGALVDIGLPDQPGDALVADIRAQAPSFPVVLSSGHGEAHVRARFGNDRFVSYLGKPYTTDQLAAALRSVGMVPPEKM